MTRRSLTADEGEACAPKDKKKKSKKDSKPGKKGADTLKALAQNPLVADVVAAALVGMASALKDSDKARRLANKAGDQLNALSKTKAPGRAMRCGTWRSISAAGRSTRWPKS